MSSCAANFDSMLCDSLRTFTQRVENKPCDRNLKFCIPMQLQVPGGSPFYWMLGDYQGHGPAVTTGELCCLCMLTVYIELQFIERDVLWELHYTGLRDWLPQNRKIMTVDQLIIILVPARLQHTFKACICADKKPQKLTTGTEVS